MSVAETVRQLADAILAAQSVASPRQRLLLELLRLMPLYCQIGNLAAWDAAYHAGMPTEDDNSEVGRLIDAAYDFASTPLYGAFEPKQIMQAYVAVAQYLCDAGVSCPTVHEFTSLCPTSA